MFSAHRLSRLLSFQLAACSRSREEGKQRSQPWSHIVHIVLVEGRDLLSMDVGHTSDPYIKLRSAEDTGHRHWLLGDGELWTKLRPVVSENM